MVALEPSSYSILLPRLSAVPANTYFAEAVLRRQVSGRVYVDHPENPAVFLVAHRCGLSLLVGDVSGPAKREWLRDYVVNASGTRDHLEVIQPWPFASADVIRECAGDRFVSEAEVAAITDPEKAKAFIKGRVVAWRRLNFKFHPEFFRPAQLAALPPGFAVRRLSPEHFHVWEGAVAPREFWDSVEDYGAHSVAYGVVQGETVAALAFAAFHNPPILEIGIETQPTFRKLGLAKHACAALIQHCLDSGLEPVWSCRGGNEGSRRTAEALGFRQTVVIPYLGLAAN